MKKIPLTQGEFTIVDDEDYEELSKFKWHAQRVHHKKGFTRVYAMRSGVVRGKQSKICMHRQIMNSPDNLDIDHLNRDSLDNRRMNLRICTRMENQQNRKDASHHGTGINKVVGLKKRPWTGRVRLGGRNYYTGFGATPEEAVAARAHFIHAYEFSKALAGT